MLNDKKPSNRINQPIIAYGLWVMGIMAFTALAPAPWAAAREAPLFLPLVSTLRIEGTLDFCGEKVPMERDEIRERFEKEFLLSVWDRPQVILWLKRSRRYLPHIEQMLEKHGLPDDLKYIAIAESALRPHAGSRKGAMGFWQFMPGTGRKYGLTVNEYVDDRRNIFSATRAAMAYLTELYRAHNSWTLAAAAYNMGEEGLQAEILEQDTTDYYRLYLPLETQRYVFRILSVKRILADPDKYGFSLSPADYYRPISFDRVKVDCPEYMPLRVVARAGKTYFKKVKDLNPQIRGHYLRKGTHELFLPKGSAEGFQARYRRLQKEFLAEQKEKIYIVKKGDNLSMIAERFGVPLAALIIWNRIDIKRPIQPGTRLIIHSEHLN